MIHFELLSPSSSPILFEMQTQNSFILNHIQISSSLPLPQLLISLNWKLTFIIRQIFELAHKVGKVVVKAEKLIESFAALICRPHLVLPC